VAYEAYAKSPGGKTFDFRDMPKWNQLPQHVRDAWDAAALAVIKHADDYPESILVTWEEP